MKHKYLDLIFMTLMILTLVAGLFHVVAVFVQAGVDASITDALFWAIPYVIAIIVEFFIWFFIKRYLVLKNRK